MFVSRSLAFTLSARSTFGQQYLYRFTTPAPNVGSDNAANWYWKQYTEDRPYEAGWSRPYKGDPNEYCDKRGMISWGHYVPIHNPREDPDPMRNAFFNRLRIYWRWDQRPSLLTWKAFTDANQHNIISDNRRDWWHGYWYNFGTAQLDWRSTWKIQTPPHLLDFLRGIRHFFIYTKVP